MSRAASDATSSSEGAERTDEPLYLLRTPLVGDLLQGVLWSCLCCGWQSLVLGEDVTGVPDHVCGSVRGASVRGRAHAG